MRKYIQIFIILLTLSAQGQSKPDIKTSKNLNEKFSEFIKKKKFVAEYSYLGIAEEKMRPVFTEKINQVAFDFKRVSESDNPTDKKYLEKIDIGLSRFTSVYMELDTEDREKVCTYFEELMDIVGLQSSDGKLNKFIYGFDPNEIKNEN